MLSQIWMVWPIILHLSALISFCMVYLIGLQSLQSANLFVGGVPFAMQLFLVSLKMAAFLKKKTKPRGGKKGVLNWSLSSQD